LFVSRDSHYSPHPSSFIIQRSQYQACSGGKLDFVPATGANSVNGVTTITIPNTASGKTKEKVSEWAFAEFERLHGSYNQWSHVVYILPSSVDFGKAAAFGYVGWGVTVYEDTTASILLVLMHEIGHNLRMLHSGANGLDYGDTTCFMGAHVYKDDGPKMCFNGAKSWFLEFYQDRHVSIQHPASWQGLLVGVDDYVNSQTTQGQHHVIARIIKPPSPGSATEENHIYLMYNKAEGINSEVVGDQDMVTVVQQNGTQTQSWKLAALNETSSAFRSTNWDGTGNALVIMVCERVTGTPDYATVLVYLENGSPAITCSARVNHEQAGT